MRAKKKREEQQAAEMARVLQEKDAMEEELEELKNNAASVGNTTVPPPTLPPSRPLAPTLQDPRGRGGRAARGPDHAPPQGRAREGGELCGGRARVGV